jgi:hypothetical protein
MIYVKSEVFVMAECSATYLGNQPYDVSASIIMDWCDEWNKWIDTAMS